LANHKTVFKMAFAVLSLVFTAFIISANCSNRGDCGLQTQKKTKQEREATQYEQTWQFDIVNNFFWHKQDALLPSN
jgi:hypothetical protein